MQSDGNDVRVDAGAPTVTVQGTALLRCEPDEAMLWITLTALVHAPGAALADVSRRSDALVAMLDELAIAKHDRSTTGVSVYEEFDHIQEGRRLLGHRAISQVSVRLGDPDLIGRLIGRAAEELGARIDGPRWQVAQTNPVRLQAAREAAANAQRKAQAYAEGAGAKLGRLVRLTEPHDTHMAARAAGELRPVAVEPMPVEPGEHEVAASIQATFALMPG